MCPLSWCKLASSKSWYHYFSLRVVFKIWRKMFTNRYFTAVHFDKVLMTFTVFYKHGSHFGNNSQSCSKSLYFPSLTFKSLFLFFRMLADKILKCTVPWSQSRTSNRLWVNFYLCLSFLPITPIHLIILVLPCFCSLFHFFPHFYTSLK